MTVTVGVCVEARLIVEVDGLSHDTAAQRDYDAMRTKTLAAAGWRVLRLRDHDVFADPGKIEREIRATPGNHLVTTNRPILRTAVSLRVRSAATA